MPRFRYDAAMEDMAPLFEVPAGDERTVTAMRVNLEQWKSQGKVLGVAQRRALMDQAEAVDLARATRRSTQVSGANRVMLELLQEFGLLRDPAPTADAKLKEFLSDVEAAANAPGAGYDG